ncbi:retrovirus-related pol polyprotein from transposon TNT 1-94 [Tanacetum coccineum]|uniref:Retrovirus-related pol polyprotein from transposon TNT 1-94 n=1 Tax=Tanacetum coccineum TaxID=301880 RepID=A0ABQ5B9U2_9ASTR
MLRHVSLEERPIVVLGLRGGLLDANPIPHWKQNRNKLKSWKIGEIKYRLNITCWNCNQKGHFQNQCLKLVASRDKEVNMARDSDDALVCCVENTVEDHIMGSGASFHATYCKEDLERFKLRSGKVRLADDKTLDITGVGDVVLKTSFGTSWTLKDVRIGMSMLASKGNVPDVRKVDIYFYKLGGLGKQNELFFIMSEKTRKLQRSCGRYNANLQVKCLKFDNGGVETDINKKDKNEAKMAKPSTEWKECEKSKSKSTKQSTKSKSKVKDEADTEEILNGPTRTHLMGRYDLLNLPHTLRSDRVAYSRGGMTREGYKSHTLEAAQMKCDTAFGIRRVTRLFEAEISHLWTRFMEPENDNIVAEQGLSSEITQSLEDQMKNNLKTEHPPRREALKLHMYEDPPESRVPVRYSPSANYLLLTQNEPDVFLSQNISRKEGIAKIVDVQGSDMAEFNKPRYTKSSIHLAKNLKVCSWAKLVQILISEGSLSLLKILGTESLAVMFTRLVMKEKLKFCAASTGLRVN